MTSFNNVSNQTTQNIVPVQGTFDQSGNVINLIGPAGKTFVAPISSTTAVLTLDTNGNAIGIVNPKDQTTIQQFQQTNYEITKRKIIYQAGNGNSASYILSGVSTGSVSLTTEVSRTTGETLKLVANSDFPTIFFTAPNPNLTPRQMGKIGMLFYCENAGSMNPVLYLSNGASGTNSMSYTMLNSVLNQGWNYVTLHPLDSGTGMPSSGGTQGSTSLTSSPWVYSGTMTLDTPVTHVGFYFYSSSDSNPLYLDSIDYGQYSKPKVILGFDAGADTSKVQYALPTFNQYGWKGYQAGDNDATLGTFSAGVFTKSTSYDTAIAPLVSAGWDIPTQGGPGHNNYASTPALTVQLNTDFDTSVSAMNIMGIKNTNLFCYPLGGSNKQTDEILRAKGVQFARSVRRFRTATTSDFGVDNLVHTGCIQIDDMPLQLSKNMIDAAILYGETVHLFCHTLIAGGNGTTVTGNTVQTYANDYVALLTYIASKGSAIDVVTPTQWLSGLNISQSFAQVITPALGWQNPSYPVLTSFSNKQIGIFLTAAYTVQIPISVGVKSGDRTTFTFTQNSTGTYAVTWTSTAGGFKGATLITGGLANQKAVVEFKWDGAYWVQTATTGWYS